MLGEKLLCAARGWAFRSLRASRCALFSALHCVARGPAAQGRDFVWNLFTALKGRSSTVPLRLRSGFRPAGLKLAEAAAARVPLRPAARSARQGPGLQAQGGGFPIFCFHSFASLTPDFHPATRKSSARRHPSLPKSGKPGALVSPSQLAKSGKPGALVSGAPAEVRGLKGPFFH
jgi:hypothetical protein